MTHICWHKLPKAAGVPKTQLPLPGMLFVLPAASENFLFRLTT
jgi:hypothetical protein